MNHETQIEELETSEKKIVHTLRQDKASFGLWSEATVPNIVGYNIKIEVLIRFNMSCQFFFVSIQRLF